MFMPLEVFLLVLIILTAIFVLEAKSIVTVVVGMAVFPLLTALTHTEMGAPDVAFTEAVINAGITGVYMFVFLAYLRKESNG